jgi:hypothetical protein
MSRSHGTVVVPARRALGDELTGAFFNTSAILGTGGVFLLAPYCFAFLTKHCPGGMGNELFSGAVLNAGGR